MKIAILGGAFDPPHMGHQWVASQVLEKFAMDEVWLMVCYTYFPEFPIKYSRITSYIKRYKMASFLQKKQIKVSDFEYRYNKASRTIDTLALLTQKYPQHKFYWIIGSDVLASFHLWDRWEELIQKYNFIIFPRDTDLSTLETRVKHFLKLSRIPKNILIAKGEPIVSNIASTHIRKRIRANLPTDSFVPKHIAEYILKNSLYICLK